MAKSRDIIDALLESSLYYDALPPRPSFEDPDAETEFYAKNAFTAWDRVNQIGRHIERLWNVIKGSPYEDEYRRRFLSKSSYR